MAEEIDTELKKYSFFDSYKERRKQYRTYSREYTKKHKLYGEGMTQKMTYQDYVAYRKIEIEESIKLGVKPKSNAAIAKSQVRIGREAARIRQKAIKHGFEEAIKREKEGKPLNKAQQTMLEMGTKWVKVGKDKDGNPIYERRMKKSITQRDIINETGLQRDIYEKIARDPDVEDFSDFYGYVK